MGNFLDVLDEGTISSLCVMIAWVLVQFFGEMKTPMM
jgi:hypothetical protein